MQLSSPSQIAQDKLARGDVAGAVAALQQACDRDDGDALLLAAIWRLVGSPLPRNLAEARRLLARARSQENMDAALIEIALTANGTGADPDWSTGLRLLENAARRDNRAADQFTLISAMKLDAQGGPASLPPARHIHESPRVEVFRGVLTRRECEHLASTVSDIVAPSVVVDPLSGRQVLHPIRQSDGAVIGPTRETMVVTAINHRLAALTATQTRQGEPLQILRYGPGQQYRLHVDTLPNTTNQRILTAIAYLNEGYTGGETEFPDLGIRFKASAGDVLVFHNTFKDRKPDKRTRHAGAPVVSGTKWIATRWIHEHIYDPWSPAPA